MNPLLQFVKEHPGCTTNDMAKAFGVPITSISSRMKYQWDKGTVVREPAGRTLSGVLRYKYFSKDASDRTFSKVDTSFSKVDTSFSKVETPKSKAPVAQAAHASVDAMLSEFVSGFAKSLVGAIVEQLKPQLEQELRAALPAALPQMPRHTPVAVAPVEPEVMAPEHVRLPKVGVIGIAPPKRFPLDSEFGSMLKLNYWWSEDPVSKLKSMASQCEVIYVMAYVSHKHTEMLTAAGANWRRINGDIRALGDALADHCLTKEAA